jgi:hypothetical protein
MTRSLPREVSLRIPDADLDAPGGLVTATWPGRVKVHLGNPDSGLGTTTAGDRRNAARWVRFEKKALGA